MKSEATADIDNMTLRACLLDLNLKKMIPQLLLGMKLQNKRCSCVMQAVSSYIMAWPDLFGHLRFSFKSPTYALHSRTMHSFDDLCKTLAKAMRIGESIVKDGTIGGWAKHSPGASSKSTLILCCS